MMTLKKETEDYIVEQLGILANIPSPSGFTHKILAHIEAEAQRFGYPAEYLNMGGLLITVPGASDAPSLAFTAHVDTLGAMVRSISDDATLRITSVGGFTMQSIEGSYCRIHTRDGREYDGTILTSSPSVHVQDDARTLERVEKNMLVRIDEEVSSKEEVQGLGIANGDYISFDPKFRALENGFIKSRHLDDKASVAILLGTMKELSEQAYVPHRTVRILISNNEEVGFGASYVPQDVQEMIAVDMGAIGEDLAGSESKVSICAKDSSGPYDYNMTSLLIRLAQEEELDYAVDIFPYYGSDVSAALTAGNNLRGALIGPGVHASHGQERTHRKALVATLRLVLAYIRAAQ